jgi:hypothetical protein
VKSPGRQIHHPHQVEAGGGRETFGDPPELRVCSRKNVFLHIQTQCQGNDDEQQQNNTAKEEHTPLGFLHFSHPHTNEHEGNSGSGRTYFISYHSTVLAGEK